MIDEDVARNVIHMPRHAPEIDTDRCGLFLDVDGTLLEIDEVPNRAPVPQVLKVLVNRLCAHLQGAVALVSSRTLHDLDQMFVPLWI